MEKIIKVEGKYLNIEYHSEDVIKIGGLRYNNVDENKKKIYGIDVEGLKEVEIEGNTLEELTYFFTKDKIKTPEQKEFDQKVNLQCDDGIFYTEDKKDTNILVFSFPGFYNKNTPYNMSLMNSLKQEECSTICFQDCYDVWGSYMLFDDDGNPLEEKLKSFIEKKIKQYDPMNIYFIGTSKGGTIALNIGQYFPNVKIFAGDPQIDIVRFTERVYPNVYAKIKKYDLKLDIYKILNKYQKENQKVIVTLNKKAYKEDLAKIEDKNFIKVQETDNHYQAAIKVMDYLKATMKEDRKKKLSIIIPTYNNINDFEHRMLKSLEHNEISTYSKIYIVDDGSTKDQQKLLEKLVNNIKDKLEVELFMFNDDGSGSASRPRNKGVEMSNESLVLFLDPDDKIIGDTHRKMIKLFNDEQVDVVLANYLKMSGTKIQNGFVDGLSGRENMIINKFAHQNVASYIFKRDLVIKNNITFITGVPSQDSVFFLEMMLKAKKIKKINEDSFIHYDQSPITVSNNITVKYYRGIKEVQKKVKSILEEENLYEQYTKEHKHEWFIEGYLLDTQLKKIVFSERKECFEEIKKIIQIYIDDVTIDKVKEAYYLPYEDFIEKYPVKEVPKYKISRLLKRGNLDKLELKDSSNYELLAQEVEYLLSHDYRFNVRFVLENIKSDDLETQVTLINKISEFIKSMPMNIFKKYLIDNNIPLNIKSKKSFDDFIMKYFKEYTYKYTLIMTSYNRGDYIFRAIDSFLNTNYKNAQLIIVDNNSEEKLKKQIQEYITPFENIELILSNVNNYCGGRNRGINILNSKYVSFLDDDDEITPDYFITFDKYLEEYDYDVIRFNAINVDHLGFLDGSKHFRISTNKTFVNMNIYSYKSLTKKIHYNLPSSCLALINTRILNENIFLEQTLFEDNPFYHEIAITANSLKMINEGLYIRNKGIESITTKKRDEKYIDKIYENMCTIYIDMKLQNYLTNNPNDYIDDLIRKKIKVWVRSTKYEKKFENFIKRSDNITLKNYERKLHGNIRDNISRKYRHYN